MLHRLGRSINCPDVERDVQYEIRSRRRQDLPHVPNLLNEQPAETPETTPLKPKEKIAAPDALNGHAPSESELKAVEGTPVEKFETPAAHEPEVNGNAPVSSPPPDPLLPAPAPVAATPSPAPAAVVVASAPKPTVEPRDAPASTPAVGNDPGGNVSSFDVSSPSVVKTAPSLRVSDFSATAIDAEKTAEAENRAGFLDLVDMDRLEQAAPPNNTIQKQMWAGSQQDLAGLAERVRAPSELDGISTGIRTDEKLPPFTFRNALPPRPASTEPITLPGPALQVAAPEPLTAA